MLHHNALENIGFYQENIETRYFRICWFYRLCQWVLGNFLLCLERNLYKFLIILWRSIVKAIEIDFLCGFVTASYFLASPKFWPFGQKYCNLFHDQQHEKCGLYIWCYWHGPYIYFLYLYWFITYLLIYLDFWPLELCNCAFFPRSLT